MKVYKYRDFDEYSISCLENDDIYLAKAKTFNDPFDSLQDFTFKEFGEKVRESIFICSMSKDCNNILMWSHYANNHRGFCIEYDIPDISFIDNYSSISYTKNNLTDKKRTLLNNLLNKEVESNLKVTIDVLKVKYSPQPIIIDDVLYVSNEYTEEDKKMLSNIIIKTYYNKYIDWSYEEEIRFILPIFAFKDIDKMKVEKGFLFPAPNITGIHLGERFLDKEHVNSSKNKVYYINKLLKFCRDRNITVYTMSQSREAYKMSSKPVLIEEVIKDFKSSFDIL